MDYRYEYEQHMCYILEVPWITGLGYFLKSFQNYSQKVLNIACLLVVCNLVVFEQYYKS